MLKLTYIIVPSRHVHLSQYESPCLSSARTDIFHVGPIKKGNRHSEILLRDVEHLATLASVYKPTEYKYPKTAINDNWEKVLLNQCE